MSSTPSVTQPVLVGRVKWFNSTSGFGFVTLQDDGNSEVSRGTDIFVHHSSIKVANEQYRYLVQGEYVEFSIVPTTQGPHKFQAVNVSGIKGGQLMCETRREVKVARNNYHSERQEESQTSPPRKRVSQSKDNNKPSDSHKPKVRGEGPRERGEWTYVVKNNKAPLDAPKTSVKGSRQPAQQKV